MRQPLASLITLTSVLASLAGGCDDGGAGADQPSAGAATGGSAGTGGAPAGSPSGGTPATLGGAGAGQAGSAGSPSSGGAPAQGGAAGSGGQAGSGGSGGGARPGFWVDGRFLKDRCGNKVVLRGINEMIVWSPDQSGASVYQEIAKTGANAVRIVWTIKDGTPEALDGTIANAVKAGLVPMIELHDATGKFELLPSLVDHWTSPAIVAVLKKHAAHLLVNIGNEVGDKVSDADFTQGYKSAISRMRAADLHMPLVIDAAGYGQNIDQLQSQGPGLIAADPDKNVLLSAHLWWTDGTASKIAQELGESVTANLPLMVGEFAQHAVYECSKHPLDYVALLSEAKTKEIGIFAWSWGQVKNSDCSSDGPFDMTTDGTFNGLTGWGKEVATTDPNSIKNTSVPVTTLNGAACAK